MEDKHPQSTNQTRYWLALNHAPGLGRKGIIRLLRHYEDPSSIFDAVGRPGPQPELETKTLNYLRSPTWADIEIELEWLQHPDRHLITLGDPHYPDLLLQTADPPPLLFVQGNPGLLSSPQLAMVGSRNPTASGRQTARDFSRHLAAAGMTITSGLAIGIDGTSHQGALDEGGFTIAVTGTGLDLVYPARHRDLAHRIAENGALVSEFPPGTPPRRSHFPRRNRIISGLSLGTLVVEAAKQSGSLITARQATDQGREVFAIPGSIHNPLARGCHDLIRQGAKLVETADDILEELGPLTGHLLELPPPRSELPPAPLSERDPEYTALLDVLGFDPTPVDLLIQRSGLTAESISSMLLLLELEGYVSSSPGGRYCLPGKRHV